MARTTSMLPLLFGFLINLTELPVVSAHGYVTNATIGGQTHYVAKNWDTEMKTGPGWDADNEDTGYVAWYNSSDPSVICHKGGKPYADYLTAAAGSTIDLQWNSWPTFHPGPIINSMAPVSGDFASVDATQLNFFVFSQRGLLEVGGGPDGYGTWATDELFANKFVSKVTFPANIPPGKYVLRHEIIALHAADKEDKVAYPDNKGAQFYPMCINFEITGGGSTDPCANGADCRPATEFYKADDPGIFIPKFYYPLPLPSYSMPGPAIWSGLSGSGTGSGTPASSSPLAAASAPASSQKASGGASASATAATQQAPSQTTSAAAPADEPPSNKDASVEDDASATSFMAPEGTPAAASDYTNAQPEGTQAVDAQPEGTQASEAQPSGAQPSGAEGYGRRRRPTGRSRTCSGKHGAKKRHIG